MSSRNLREVLVPLTPPALRSGYQRLFKPEDARKAAEKRRLAKLPRYIAGETDIVGRPFRYIDAASFLSAYTAIFERGIYRFTAANSEPVILDCGANIGLSVLYFKQLYPAARITAFEPDPAIFAVLSDNCQRFGLEHMTLVNSATWRNNDTLHFSVEGADGGYLAVDGVSAAAHPTTSVSAVRLAHYLNAPIDMLKMDIEGAEVEVLLDCEHQLKHVDRMFVEYHSFIDQPQRSDELLALLRRCGFRTHLHSEVNSPQPFVHRIVSNCKDDRLNIFAFRP